MRALHASADAVLLTDGQLEPPGPKILWANDTLQALTGYGERELIGATPRLFQGPQTDRALLAALKRALAAGDPFHGETVNYRKDGRPYWVEWDIAPVRDDSGAVECFISIQRDVSERRSRELRLQQMTQALERSNRELERYARAVSHDLRSPMQLIHVYAELLQRSAAERLTAKEREHLEALMDVVDRMGASVGSLYDLARAGTGHVTIGQVDLNAALSEACVDLSPEIECTKARIETAPLGKAWGDATMLRLAFQNILSNAMKHRHPRRRPVVRVRPMTDVADGMCGIFFDDNGRGIPGDEAERVFDDGYRIDGQTEGEGSGTGLASVRRLLAFCGGRVELLPKRGAGSRFAVSLPAVVP